MTTGTRGPAALFVCDPLSGFDVEVDATAGLMAAAQALAAEVWWCRPEELAVVDGRVCCRARRIRLRPRRRGHDHRWLVDDPWWDEYDDGVLDVAREFELVQLRIDPPVDARYLHTTYLLDLVEAAGCRVVNRPEGIRALHEKLAVLRWPWLAPRTLVSAQVRALREFVTAVGAAVVKPVDGFGGADVWLVRDDHTALALLETATRSGTRHVIAQEHLPAVEHGNKRLFLLDGEVVGAVVRRPTSDDFRIGPPVSAAEVDADDERILAAVVPELARLGIALAGLDVIGGRLIEVNVTCPGGTAKADALLGTDLSGLIIRRLLAPSPERLPA